jgi:hypothetical protein
MEFAFVKVTLRSCRAFSFPDGTLKDEDKRMVVWWYGPVTKNLPAGSVPKVAVFFRYLDDQNNLGKITKRDLALTHLGLLRIGSVWRKGACETYFPHDKAKFDVSFSEGGWQLITFADLKSSYLSSEAEADITKYLSETRNHKTYFINFFLPNGKHLLIPCVEFFSRCYGSSSEVNRVLATYPWKGVKERLFKPLDEPPQPGTWPIKLNWRMHKGDAILLAHILYDPYAKLAAKNIYSYIEADFLAGKSYSLLRATPWFQGEGQLAVSGISIDGGNAFLALRVLGSSQPGGTTIQREKEQRVATDEGKDNDDSINLPSKRQPGIGEIIDLTDDTEPDHGSSWLDIEEEKFAVLGKPREVIDKWRDRNSSANRQSTPKPGDENRFSTGEAFGAGKDVGKAHLYTSLEMESQGILRDMWTAFRYLHKSHPNRIRKVEWFTFENGFSAYSEPKLIQFNPIEDDTNITTSVKHWPFIDYDKQKLRGALVIRVMSDTKYIYIIEIQRKHIASSADSNEVDEETISGLCFVLDDDAVFDEWLRRLLSEIRYKKGIFKKVLNRCPGHADAFVHRRSTNDSVFCEAAAKNALRKMGLKL